MLDPVPEIEVLDTAFVPPGHSTPRSSGTPTPRASPPPCCKGPTYFRVEKEIQRQKENEEEGLCQLHEVWELRYEQHRRFLRKQEEPGLLGLCGAGSPKVSVLQAVRAAEQAVKLASQVMHATRDYHPPGTDGVGGAEDVYNYMSGYGFGPTEWDSSSDESVQPENPRKRRPPRLPNSCQWQWRRPCWVETTW